MNYVIVETHKGFEVWPDAAGYLSRPTTTHRWMNTTEEIVIFECSECSEHWDSNITREEWLRAGESQ